MIVVDSNVLVYLWAGGHGALLADAVFQRDPVWIAPILWRSEFRNALLQLVRARRVSPDRAPGLLREAERQMDEREFTVESHTVLTLAIESGCTAYDCEYVALARDFRISLVTFDEQVQDAFPALAVAPEAFARD